MICRQWGSMYSTVAFVGLCRCTSVVLPGVRGWRETVAVAVVVSKSVGSGLGSSGRRLVSRAGVS